MEIAVIRSKWTEVLNVLERENRIAWLVFFDARLSKLEGSTLELDFSDSEKFATGHEYREKRQRMYPALQQAMREVLNIDLKVIEKS